jgi:hypothetical protein
LGKFEFRNEKEISKNKSAATLQKNEYLFVQEIAKLCTKQKEISTPVK